MATKSRNPAGRPPRPLPTDKRTGPTVWPFQPEVEAITAPEKKLERKTYSVRLLEKTATRLGASARENGRSLTEEIEHRLHKSLLDDEHIGSLETQALLRAIAATMWRAEQRVGEWWRDEAGVAEMGRILSEQIELQLGYGPAKAGKE